MNTFNSRSLAGSQGMWRKGLAAVLFLFLSPLACAQTVDPQNADQYFDAIQERLELTDEQVAEMRPIVEDSRQRQRDILAGYGIDMESDEAPKIGRRDAMAMRKEMKAIRGDMLDKLESILTEDQLEAFAELQEEQAATRRAAMRERFRR